YTRPSPPSRTPPMSILDDPKHWRERAKKSRAVAELLSDPGAKETMLRIAEDYERLAANSATRHRSRSEAIRHAVTLASKRGPNPTDVHVGSRVRMRHRMLGMSQEKLGEALGLAFQQVQKYEKGKNRIG